LDVILDSRLQVFYADSILFIFWQNTVDLLNKFGESIACRLVDL